MELSLDGTKFVKTETGWVDKKSKEPASLDYQTLLSKIEKSSMDVAPAASSQSFNTTLPKSSSGTSKASDDIKALDKKLVLLTKSIEKLIKTLDKQPNRQNQPAIPVEATPASVPITKETAKEVAAMKAKDPTLTSKKALEQFRERQSAQLAQPADKKPSLLKETGKEYAKSASNIVRGTVEAAFPILKPLFRANDNIKAKKQEAAEKLEKKPQGSGFKSVADAINPISSKFSAKKFTEDSEKSIQTVNISDSSIEKIAQAIKPGKEKEKDSKGLAGLFSKLENIFKNFKLENIFKKIGFGGGAKAAGVEAEIVKDLAGKSRYAKGAVDATGKKIGGQFVKAEAEAVETAVKKPGILSKIFGSGAKKAGVEGAEKLAAKAGGSLLSKGLRGIPVLGAIAGAGLSGYETYKESGSVGKALFSGGGSLLGGLGGEVVGSAAGPVGTVAGGIAGSIGGGKLGEVAYDKFFGKKGKTTKMSKSEMAFHQKQDAEEDAKIDDMASRPSGTYVAGQLVKPIGMTPQSKALASANYNNAKAKDERTKSAASPSVNNYAPTNITNVNNSQGSGAADRTVGPRGALDLPMHASPYSSMVA